MIVFPTKGMARSIEKHNIKFDIFIDWVEASIVFGSDEISQTEIVDRLIEEEIYEDQDMAREIVNEVWIELERRVQLCSNSYGLSVEDNWIRRTAEWREKPAHSFCLLLSISPAYDWWSKEFGSDYNEQGELFEVIIEESLEALAPDWYTYRTGWGRSNDGFKRIAQEVSNIIGDGRPNFENWDVGSAKDMTLDVLFYRKFEDGRHGFPYYLIQCASGGNWENKVTYPDLNIWGNIISPPTRPMRGFAIPFSLSEEEFKRKCFIATGLLLDRCRILSAGQVNQQWLSQETCDRILEWADTRVNTLQSRSK